MISQSTSVCLAFAPQPTQGAPAGGGAGLVQLLGPLVLIGIMFYFMFFRPQQVKAKQHATLLKSLKPGDKVLTSGGIVGVVVSVKEKSVSIRSADTKLEVLKSAVSEITEKATSPSGEP